MRWSWQWVWWSDFDAGHLLEVARSRQGLAMVGDRRRQ
jgi:hypothetical protein